MIFDVPRALLGTTIVTKSGLGPPDNMYSGGRLLSWLKVSQKARLSHSDGPGGFGLLA